MNDMFIKRSVTVNDELGRLIGDFNNTLLYPIISILNKNIN